MALLKRVTLFILVNILVVTVISFILYLFNIGPYLQGHGLDYASLAIFCLIWGMGGAFISLGLSRIMAKWMMGVQVIDPNTRDASQRQVLEMVYDLAKKAGLPAMPEVGIYQSPELNAFATGPTKRRALVAISSGLLQKMPEGQVEGVIGHEITHVANGDMVTMTLLQGIVNAFVMFMARVIAFAVSKAIRGNRDDGEVSPFLFQMMVLVFQILFMFLGAIVIASFSRYREYRADAGGARLAGPQKMIDALQTLKKTYEIQDPDTHQPAFQAFKISSSEKLLSMFASHPPLDDRIARLRKLYQGQE